MEQATLRPVPLRPAGPVDPAEALEHVRAALPELEGDAARALSLIEIAGRTREQTVTETELAPEQLATALYLARKALRRSIFPLSASGWCERAERLLSDRLDGVLVPPGPARLDVHLRNCERCTDHERRLAHAREKLVRDFLETHPESAAGPAERSRVAELRVVEPTVVEEPEPETWTGPSRLVPGFGGPVIEPAGDTAPPFASFAGPGGQSETEPPDTSQDPPLEEEIDFSEPGDATPSEHDAETADPLVPSDEDAVETPARPNPSVLWVVLMALSVGLALGAVLLTILALAGVHHLF